MIRTLLHRVVHALQHPAGARFSGSDHEIMEAIDALEARLSELRRELGYAR